MICMFMKFCYSLFPIIIFVKKKSNNIGVQITNMDILHKSKADLVSTMVGYTKAKTHNFSILQTNDHSYKAFRILQMLTSDTISFSLLVIVLYANNLLMFLTNVVIAGAASLSAFSISASFTNRASGFLCFFCLVLGCSSPFSIALRSFLH